MATIHFYEKPGCINNTRQKVLLEAAGHEVIAYNLLTEAWTPSRLQPFFGQRPVGEWFNQSAPQIKSGEIIPEHLDCCTALQLMVDNPLLIRRPLMQVEAQYAVGFEQDDIDRWIGLKPIRDRTTDRPENLIPQDLQTCPRTLNRPLNH
ncbi:MAG: ArsC/Spx/MgsR family protein [Leptolyngbyaceae cyanobacterium bins.349]|nr:ArsC/Spx/MgsR family protein [Leptolyngbyaceae cyanobacterium bins.349]